MIKKIIDHIKKYNLIQPGDRVIVGVSGGPDSMALLHILKNLTSTLNFEVIAAHLNHGLRDEAEDEERFVKEQCQEWNISFYSRQNQVRELAREQKKSLEDAGRMARYEYFRELAKQLGANRIATAHHQDDMAETVLLHLLRGTGMKGLRGIMPFYDNIIRPLLPVSKTDLLSYLELNKINYCLDNSNYDPAYLRNRIRHELLPYLEKEFNPRIVDNLNHLAFIVQDENEVLEEECGRLWNILILQKDKDVIELDNLAFLNLPMAYQRRLILKILANLAGEPGWELMDVQKIIDLSKKNGSSLILQLKKKVKVNKSYDKMVFTTSLRIPAKFKYIVSVPGEIYISETGDEYSFQLIDKEVRNSLPNEIYLDYDKLIKPLYLRSRKEGDIFRPYGLKGSKKLKKFFIDLKVPYLKRDQVPLLVSADDEIYAVLGLRISQTAVVDNATRTILVIKKQ